MLKLAVAAAATATFVFASGSALADTASANFQVKMTIVRSCSVTAGNASDISLGTTVQPTATNQTGNNTISVTCSKTTPYTVGLLPSSTNGGTTDGTGAMSSVANSATNTDKVPYALYSNAGNSTVWGNTTGTGANVVGGTGTGAAITHTVYAKNTNANFTPDSYADTVTVTVTY
ncbi:Csu type fimbrial protein [Variovorax boronicumulans]|uniref:Csu type fimbrial protein n=1 Tax=Variovorax boronicumulans TaxID=436515 RepID=UPI0012E5768D|nr:spore coat protein U domain-containing protein [Variovorax boronicumulans]GER17113.1 SCPU domain-containing protein [Variovorax boronicumulans]